MALTAVKESAKLWNGQTEAEAVRDRLYLLQQITKSQELRAVALERCRRDLIFWVENFVWTFDPRRLPASPLIPFLLFPRQREYLQWRVSVRSRRSNGICEKSRDSGMSWLNICDQLHLWLFTDNFKGAFGSAKEDLVDHKGDPDSIFEKMRILIRNLPHWMLPTGFDEDKHDNFKRLLNPANGSVITGESGDDCGRGGRSFIYDWDEVAFTPHPLMIESALSNSSNTIYYTSSANGFNFFYRKVSHAPSEDLFRFFWKFDPRKDDAWYAEQCKKYDKTTVAQEIDIDYGASVEGIFIPAELVMAAVNLELPLEGDRLAAMDVAVGGKAENVLGFRIGPVVQIIDAWKGLDTTQTSFRARKHMVELGLKRLNYDVDGVGAGCAGTFNNIEDLEFEAVPLRGGSTPSKTKWPGEGKTSQQKFYNGRAEWYGLLFDRFKKTYDHVHGIVQYPLDELISIPNHPKLIQQLSSPKKKYAPNGKTLVESKKEMLKRGVASPDHADMCAYLFAPTKTIVKYDSRLIGLSAR